MSGARVCVSARMNDSDRSQSPLSQLSSFAESRSSRSTCSLDSPTRRIWLLGFCLDAPGGVLRTGTLLRCHRAHAHRRLCHRRRALGHEPRKLTGHRTLLRGLVLVLFTHARDYSLAVFARAASEVRRLYVQAYSLLARPENTLYSDQLPVVLQDL